MKPLGWALVAVSMAMAVFVVLEGPARIGPLLLQGRQAMVADEHTKHDETDEQQILIAVEGAKSIKLAMPRPDSFTLDSMTLMPSGAVCYVYWSQNARGERIKAAAVLFKEEIATLETQGFDLRWRDQCQGKQGKDVTGFGELMVY
jgi:hypothetical protein